MIFTFIVPANTNSPLWSLATATIEENRGPTASSTLILKDKPGGGIQVWVEEGTCCLLVEASEFLCSKKRHEILEATPSIFRVLSPNMARFLYLQTMSQRMAPYNKKSSLWPKHWLTKKGGDKRKLTKSAVETKANESILTPQWFQNHKDLAKGQTANQWRYVSKAELHKGQHPSTFSLNLLITSMVGKTLAAILHKCILRCSWVLDLQIWPLI